MDAIQAHLEQSIISTPACQKKFFNSLNLCNPKSFWKSVEAFDKRGTSTSALTHKGSLCLTDQQKANALNSYLTIAQACTSGQRQEKKNQRTLKIYHHHFQTDYVQTVTVVTEHVFILVTSSGYDDSNGDNVVVSNNDHI